MGFTRSLEHACLATLNGMAAIAMASLALSHFNTKACINISDTSTWGSNPHYSFCLPEPTAIKFAKPMETFFSDQLGDPFAKPLLTFSASVAGILSIYFAKHALDHLKEALI